MWLELNGAPHRIDGEAFQGIYYTPGMLLAAVELLRVTASMQPASRSSANRS